MIVQAQVTIHAPKAAVWAAITDIENAAKTIQGIDKIEMVDKPANGALVGMRWRETRMFFGKPATVEKCITEAAEGEFYTTKAVDDGNVYLCTKRVSEAGSGGVTLAETHESRAGGVVGRVMMGVMGPLFKGVARKAITQDLNDLKAATERT